MLSKEKENRKVCETEGGGGGMEWERNLGLAKRKSSCRQLLRSRGNSSWACESILSNCAWQKLSSSCSCSSFHSYSSSPFLLFVALRFRSTSQFALQFQLDSHLPLANWEHCEKMFFLLHFSGVSRGIQPWLWPSLSPSLSLTSSLLLSLSASPAPEIYKFLFAFVKFERKRKNFEYGKLGSSINATNSNCSLKGTSELVWKNGTTFPLQLVSGL